jgi:type VI secretion system secreted protein Hcp
MAISTFIKFDGIAGESIDKAHPGEIEVHSWNWGLSNAGVAGGAGGGSGSGKATPREFNFVHAFDKASPILEKNCALGKRIKSAVLSVRKAGEGQKDHLKITLSDVLVTSCGVNDYGNFGPMEEVALFYGAITVSYQAQDPNGSLGTPVTFDWNIMTGKIT